MRSTNPVEIPSGLGNVVAVTAGPDKRLMGWSIRESALVGALAKLIIRKGVTISGEPLSFIHLSIEGTDKIWLGDGGGINVSSGIFIERLIGTSHISLWIES